MNCKNCIHWGKCSKTNGKTRYYGENIASDNVEELCEWFISTSDVVPKSEVERLQAEVDQLHALLECGVFANSVEDWQKFLNEKRAEVARQIFEEIEKIIQNRRNEEIKRQGDNKMVSPFTYCYDALNVIQHQIAELKKKYTEGSK